MTALVFAASLLLAGPSVLAALTGRGSVDTALWHLALALLVCTVAARVLRAVVTGYERSAAESAAAAEAAEADRVRADGEDRARRREDA